MEDNSALLASITDRFGESPFIRVLGLRIESITEEQCVARFAMRPDLLGNMDHRILHGGVTSAVLDTIGGITASVGAIVRLRDADPAERTRRLARLGTLDMRVDYLKPGRGDAFTVSGRLLRAGGQVMVTRMEMHNEEGELQAAATGTYLY